MIEAYLEGLKKDWMQQNDLDAVAPKGDVMDREAKMILNEYLKNLSEYYEMVEEWLKEKSFFSKKIDHDMHESASGKYTTQKMLIYKDKDEKNKIAELIPVGAWTIGANGRVDLIGNFDQENFIYLKEDIKIRISLTTSVNDEEHPVSNNARSLYRGFERPGWYWVENRKLAKAHLIKKDLFFDLLSEVSNYEL